ncbi:MAG: DUF4416 family protein [bacterium]|nr:DUF4416 family protein [candidate division KSB1 bacterium]MDH7560179.1 DUF4416 family protein [bacterium]
MCLFCAVTYNSQEMIEEAQRLLQNEFGEITLQSEHYPFSFSDYYAEEMGQELFKFIVSFSSLIQPDRLADIKLRTNVLEQRSATAGRRNLNLDPGYLDGAKVVVATTKNYDHRIYLGQGIYGDLHLRYRHGRFQPLEWTYPDYRLPLVLDFLSRVRAWYLNACKTEEKR